MFHGRTGRHGDVGDVRRKFDDHRLVGQWAQTVHQIGEGHRVGAYAHAAGGDVRAADVDFQHVRVGVGELFHHFGIVVVTMSGDVGDDECARGLELGQVFGQIVVDAGILQAHGVDVRGRRFGGARRGVAFPRHGRCTLGAYGAELADIVEPADSGVLECAGGGADRVLPFQTGHLSVVLPHVGFVQVDVVVVALRGLVVCAHRHSPHPSCSRVNTGPSEQTLSRPSTVSMVHSTQVP